VPDLVIAGPLKRTLQMAEIAARIVSESPVAIEVDERLREIDYGPDEGLEEDKVIARIGSEALQNWDQHAIVPPGWEVDPAVLRQNWHDIAGELATNYSGKIILIVTSNGIARFAPYITGDFERFKANFPLK